MITTNSFPNQATSSENIKRNSLVRESFKGQKGKLIITNEKIRNGGSFEYIE